MDTSQTHYLSYDPEEIWKEMHTAYVNAGGDILYPGDEKEILLRAVLAILTQAFAGVDNALRMGTLRYAVGDYLDLYGEKRNCARMEASAAETTVEIVFRASGIRKTIAAGSALTADGEMYYGLAEDILQTGYAQTLQTAVVCRQTGNAGNGLLSGTQMQLAVPNAAVVSIFTVADAAGGGEREDDDTYRERIRQYGLSSLTTGPATQYESMAMSVTSEILDAKAINLGAGSVGVYLILQSDEGTDAILASVAGALSAADVRPLTDLVSVYRAEAVAYTLAVRYTADTDANATAAIAAAVETYQAWQDETIGRAFNPDKLIALIYQAGATRVVWGDGSQFNGGTVAYTQIGESQRCLGTITLEAM